MKGKKNAKFPKKIKLQIKKKKHLFKLVGKKLCRYRLYLNTFLVSCCLSLSTTISEEVHLFHSKTVGSTICFTFLFIHIVVGIVAGLAGSASVELVCMCVTVVR